MKRFALVALVAFACDDERLVGRVAALDHPIELDFGPVPVGTSRILVLPISNSGDLSVRIDRFVADAPSSVTVETNPASLAVAPGVEVPVEVRFSPLTVTGPLRFDLVLVTAELGERTVRVTGEGVREGFSVHPRPLDFGRVLRGYSATRELEIESLSHSDAPLAVSIEPSDRFALDDPLPERIRPGDRMVVRFRYTPASDGPPGRDDAVATWSPCPDRSCDVRVPFIGTALTAPVRCTPNPVDFGALRPGSARAASIRCRNESEQAIETSGSNILERSDPGFLVVDLGPRRLLPGESEDFALRFEAPGDAELGPREGSWVLDLVEVESGRFVPPASVALVARVGGPALRVRPAAVDFGRAAVGIDARAHVDLTNVGDQDLTVQGFEGQGPFSAEPASDVLLISPGQTERLPLVFTATAAGPARGSVRFRSDDPERPEVTVDLRGRGLELSDCELEFTPSRADFGVLSAFRATVLGVALRNVGQGPCLVREPRTVGSAFSWARGEEEQLLLPGEVSVHVLRFAPKDAVAYDGAFEVLISNPQTPFLSVPLGGRGGFESPIVAPDAVDFGDVGRNCSASQTIRLHRGPALPPTLDGLEIVSSGGGFTLEHVRADPPEVRVRYQPSSDPGSQPEVGRLSWPVAGQGVGHVTLLGRPVDRPLAVERFRQGGLSAVDLLVVVDSSASMERLQADLRAGMPRLLGAAAELGVDLRLALVNMDVDLPCRRELEAPLSGFRSGTCGFFSEGDAARRDSRWRVLSSATVPSFEAAFQHTSNFGIEGSPTEAGFLAAELALQPRRLLGYNRGLLERTDSFFAVLFVGDEPEQSPSPQEAYAAGFAAIAGAFDRDRYALTGLLLEECSQNDAPESQAYARALCAAGGVIGSIVSGFDSEEGLGPVIDEVARAAFGQRRRFVLGRPALSSSVVAVEVDGVPLSATSSGRTRWRYRPRQNVVDFERNSVPAFGSEVVIRYRPLCEPRVL